MQEKRVALVTGANQGIGLQIAKELAAKSFTVLVGSRDFARGEEAAKTIDGDAASPGFTRTNLNNYAGTETVEEGAREAVRLALLGPDGPTGTFSHAKLGRLPW
ncbi:SDR family NAD(P)-dependent oxidoreductase [Sorangium sp. So ce1078]|uniref:SDR family NAD(P)-dependent oxidoreductase n=1 Tax=Sorangium sp. So ce1078 TaxID=3133329 RepID=UPI003F606923